MPWLPALVLACVVVALGSMVLERLLYSRLYTAGELEQVLFTIGLIFVAVAVARLAYGPLPLAAPLPDFMKGQTELARALVPDLPRGRDRLERGAHRACCGSASSARAGARWCAPRWTTARMAQSVGINTGRLFTFTFALGSGLAALGGALGADLIAMTPTYPFEQLVYFLIVVSIGGLGTLARAVPRRAADRDRRHRVQVLGAAVRRVLRLRGDDGDPAVAAAGPAREERPDVRAHASIGYAGAARLRPIELAPWVLAVAVLLLRAELPAARRVHRDHHPVRAVARPHPRLRRHRDARPRGVLRVRRVRRRRLRDPRAPAIRCSGCVVAAVAAGLLGLATGAVILRTHGLALLMLTLAITSIVFEVANKWTDVTGGADGLHSVPIQPILGMFRFDMFGKTAFLVLPDRARGRLVAGARRSSIRRSGVALAGMRENDVRMHAIGAPVYRRRLYAYTISATLAGIAGGAAHADDAVRRAVGARLRAVGRAAGDAGARRRVPDLRRVRRAGGVHRRAGLPRRSSRPSTGRSGSACC